jgi:hypothetical protein
MKSGYFRASFSGAAGPRALRPPRLEFHAGKVHDENL